MKKETISTIGYNQIEMIQNILDLHVPQKFIDIDPTYSKGVFYKNGEIKEPKKKFDLLPQTEDTKQSCATDLPIKRNSVNCVMFDPPFLATTGKSLKINNSSNYINKRFGVLKNEKELHVFYKKALIEFYRILKKEGILIFKCQDKVSSAKNYFSHIIIMQQALNVGFYPKDLFILLAKNRLISGKVRKQQHARKFHSYFWVFEKRKSKIDYETLIKGSGS